MVFFPGLDWIQSPWGLFPTVALHWLHRRVLSVLERLNMCHSCDCMHQTSQSAFSVTGICKDKKSGCFISAAASVLFWGLHSVFKTLHLSCLLLHVGVIISLPAWTDVSIYCITNKSSFISYHPPLDGILMGETWVCSVSNLEFAILAVVPKQHPVRSASCPSALRWTGHTYSILNRLSI